MDEQEVSIGTNIRRIRRWRDLSLEAAAGLSGFSKGYLSQIENGRVPVDRRSTLEAIAGALRVAPSELAEQPFPPSGDKITGEAKANIAELESVLADSELGELAGQARPWPAVAADLETLNEHLRPAADYAAEGLVLPGLLHELHTLYVIDPSNRLSVLRALMDCYQASAFLLKNLGIRGLPALAAFHARRVAEELDEPAWLGLAAWLRAQTLGGAGRERTLELSRQGAASLEEHLDSADARQMYGALHLNAALASAVLKRPDDTASHLDEASDVANRLPSTVERRGFGSLYFGPNNVGIWRVTIAVELGDPGKAREIAREVNPDEVPSAARRAAYWADLGRGMATQSRTREQAVSALMRAEQIAPQRIRTNPLVRETVGELIRRAKRDAGGRELRGLAYRMGLSN